MVSRLAIAHHRAMEDESDQFEQALAEALARWSISLTPAQQGQFRLHYEALVQTNRAFNLTRITDPVEVAVKHCADSLALMLWADASRIEVKTLLDMGTGGGFPAVPLAIMRPEWAVTAIDATRKKIGFLSRTAEAMGLGNLHAVHAHSKHWQADHLFQVVILRAIGKLGDCLRWGHPLMAPNGLLVVYKTASLASGELAEGCSTAARLQLREHERFCYDLECAGDTIHRALHVYERLP